MKIRYIISSLAFIAVILGLSVFAWIKPADEFSTSERRPFDQFPELTVKSLLSGDFTRDFEAVLLAPQNKQSAARKMLALGKFIANTVTTVIHVKQWYLLNEKLILARNASHAVKLLDQIEQLAKEEITNAENTIPLVEYDSRLGWEPTLEYMTDRAHLEWKIRQVRSTLTYDIPQYREILLRHAPQKKIRS